jgi:hypothetical protein
MPTRFKSIIPINQKGGITMFKRISYSWVCVIATMLLISGGMLIQDEVVASELTFAATGQAATLTVAGEGVYLQIHFAAGETPWLALFDEDGNPFPDGNYKYELRTQPFINTAALKEAEEMGDDRTVEEISRLEQEQMKVQTGSFEIVGGAIVPHEIGQDPLAQHN